MRIGLALGLLAAILTLAALLFLGGTSGPSSANQQVTIYMTPDCNCCKEYVKYLEAQGFNVDKVLVNASTLYKIMEVAPRSLWSCHVLRVEGYYVIGHVPVEVINKLLTEKPDVTGISLPGMPPGSPGMPGEATGPLTIYYFRYGSVGVYVKVKI